MTKQKPPMELAINFDEKNAKKFLPGYAQIKYDGIPLTFKRVDGKLLALTRQNEVFTSVPHIIDALEQVVIKEGASVTMECIIPGMAFKDSGGIIRRKVPDADTARIIGIVFDANLNATAKETYYVRMQQIKHVREAWLAAWQVTGKKVPWHVVVSVKVETLDDVIATFGTFKTKIRDIEGMMIHALTKPFQPGKRCHGMCRYKPQPTIDLLVHSYEEAVSLEGEPLGRVGRVNVYLRRQGRDASVVGVGPGKLTHDEAKAIWQAAEPIYSGALGPTKRRPRENICAEIKYMPDPSYDALRQPTIQRLRTDKTEGDILAY